MKGVRRPTTHLLICEYFTLSIIIEIWSIEFRITVFNNSQYDKTYSHISIILETSWDSSLLCTTYLPFSHEIVLKTLKNFNFSHICDDKMCVSRMMVMLCVISQKHYTPKLRCKHTSPNYSNGDSTFPSKANHTFETVSQ